MKNHEKILFGCLIAYFSIFVVLFYYGFSKLLCDESNLDLTAKIATILGAFFTAVAAYISFRSAFESKKSAEINLYLATINTRTEIKNALIGANYILSKSIFLANDYWKNANKIILKGDEKHNFCMTEKERDEIKHACRLIDNPSHLLDRDLADQLRDFFNQTLRLVKNQRCHRAGTLKEQDFEISKEDYKSWMSERLKLLKKLNKFIDKLNLSLLPPKK